MKPSTALIDLGEFNGVSIAARDDQYVNATEMCKACGKYWNHYWSNEQTQEFVKALALDTGIPVSKLILIVRGRGDAVRQGTWVHRKVAIHLAQWLSPQFAVWCINRLDDLFQTGTTFVNREHAELQIVREAVDRMAERVLGPLSGMLVGVKSEVDNHGVVLNRHELILNRIDSRVARIENDTARNRKPLKDRDKETHRRFVKERLNGICPCCEVNQVVSDNTVVGEFDHWVGRQHNSLAHTWLVCSACNSRLARDPEFKKDRQNEFAVYQKRLERSTRPLFDGDA